jgi:hypothetical protein
MWIPGRKMARDIIAALDAQFPRLTPLAPLLDGPAQGPLSYAPPENSKTHNGATRSTCRLPADAKDILPVDVGGVPCIVWRRGSYWFGADVASKTSRKKGVRVQLPYRDGALVDVAQGDVIQALTNEIRQQA